MIWKFGKQDYRLRKLSNTMIWILNKVNNGMEMGDFNILLDE